MRITGPGLAAIAVLTTVLWTCILIEHWTVSQARTEAYRALSEIHALQLKKRVVPSAAPVRPERRTMPDIG